MIIGQYCKIKKFYNILKLIEFIVNLKIIMFYQNMKAKKKLFNLQFNKLKHFSYINWD